MVYLLDDGSSNQFLVCPLAMPRLLVVFNIGCSLFVVLGGGIFEIVGLLESFGIPNRYSVLASRAKM